MKWRKQYKAAIQWRLDNIVQKDKLDALFDNAFRSGRNSLLQEQGSENLWRQQEATQQNTNPLSILFGELAG